MHVYNHKGMKVPGMIQDGGALGQAALGGGLKALAKKASKFLKTRKNAGRLDKNGKKIIDGKDLSKLKFKGVNRWGQKVTKTGVKGKPKTIGKYDADGSPINVYYNLFY
jgi:hypothetical protein